MAALWSIEPEAILAEATDCKGSREAPLVIIPPLAATAEFIIIILKDYKNRIILKSNNY
jgi:hypothetical protein